MRKTGKFLTGLALLASLAGSVKDSGAAHVIPGMPDLVEPSKIEYPTDIKDSLEEYGLVGRIDYDVFLKPGNGDTLVVDNYELSNISANRACDTYFSRTYPNQLELVNAARNGSLDELFDSVRYFEHNPWSEDSLEVNKEYVDMMKGSEYMGEIGVPEFIETSGYLDSLKFVNSDGEDSDSAKVSFYVESPYDSLRAF